VIVFGWPEAAGSVTRSLMMGAGVISALASLVLAAQRAGMLRRAREMRRAGHYQDLALTFSARALACADVKIVLQEAVALIAASLDVEYCAVLESAADPEGALVLRAGVGWPADSLNCLVASEDGSLLRADHFATGVWEHESGVGSGISIRLEVGHRAYGLLDICTNVQRVFCPEELDFLNSMGRLVGAAIERGQADHADDSLRPTELARAS
jgi:GAF domain-containing protein